MIMVEGEEEARLFTAAVVDVTGDTTALDLAADPFHDLHVVAVVPHGELSDARSLRRYVPPDADPQPTMSTRPAAPAADPRPSWPRR